MVDETARPPETKFWSALGRVCEGTTTWWSPARALINWRVRWSATPGKMTLVPKRVKKPSAASPQRTRAWERSCRQASVTSPCPPPSAASAGNDEQRGDVGHLVEGEDHRCGVGRPREDGGADLFEQGDHQRGHAVLLLGRGADVEGVRRAGEGDRVEVRVLGGFEHRL